MKMIQMNLVININDLNNQIMFEFLFKIVTIK